MENLEIQNPSSDRIAPLTLGDVEKGKPILCFGNESTDYSVCSLTRMFNSKLSNIMKHFMRLKKTILLFQVGLLLLHVRTAEQ